MKSFSARSLLFALCVLIGIMLSLGGRVAYAEGVAGKSSLTKVTAKSKVKASARKEVRKKRVVRASNKRAKKRSSVRRRAAVPVSVARVQGLNKVADPLRLGSSVAFVVDQDTNEVLFSKNEAAVLPIASITKLMTGLIINDAALDLDETIKITSADIDRVKGSSSRLRVGTTLTRGEALHLALMSSENRAAHALARTFPGGEAAFVANMNAKAALLGMHETIYVDPTGLSSKNQSSARDLAVLVNVAYERPLLRELSTAESYSVLSGRRRLEYRNSNSLVRNDSWEIGLQKTGYIREAGRCLVMQVSIARRNLIMVFLDSNGKYTRLADAKRIRKWLESEEQKAKQAANHSPKQG